MVFPMILDPMFDFLFFYTMIVIKIHSTPQSVAGWTSGGYSPQLFLFLKNGLLAGLHLVKAREKPNLCTPFKYPE
jgi:hypothetical protein